MPAAQQRVHDVFFSRWFQQFKEDEAIVLHFDPNQRLIEQIEHRYQSMTCGAHLGANYILVVFQDLLHPIDEKLLAAVEEVKNLFGGVTAGTLLRTLWCSYAGTYGGTDLHVNRTVEENIQRAAKLMKYEKNVIVSEYPSTDYGYCWEPVVRFLDALRRDNSLMQSADASYTLGYFRYHSFDADSREALVQEVKQLERKVYGDGTPLLKQNMKTALDQLKLKAEQCIDIDPDVQPVHPDLYLSRFTGIGAWLRRQSALKPGGSYEIAANATKAAVNETAEHIRTCISEVCRRSRVDYAQITENVDYGTLLENADTTIMESLGKYPDEAWLDIKYRNEEDYAERIRTYLQYIMASQIWNEQQLYCQDLCTQLNHDQSKHRQALQEASDDLRKKKLNLLELPSAGTFLQESVLTENRRHGISKPFSMNAISITLCIDYGAKAQDKADWEQAQATNAANYPKKSQIAFVEMQDAYSTDPICVIQLCLFANSEPISNKE